MKNDSFDIRSKYWILPCGRVVDVTLSEHALLARARMLGIPEDIMHECVPINSLFRTLDDEETRDAQDRGSSLSAIEFLLQDNPDPRVYAIRQWNWIRTRKNAFYARDWATENQRRLLESKEFWAMQPNSSGNSWLILYDLDGHEIGGTLDALKKNLAGV